ncbi:MAG: hypothetical protein IT422_14305 [Pirellulaceae bacterium]|nr:hypothetical protein [Pirellulaceae bacterium]
MKIPAHGGTVQSTKWPDAPPSAPAQVRRSSQPTSDPSGGEIEFTIGAATLP